MKLDTILDNQEQFELIINEQNNKISELEKLGRRMTEVDQTEPRKGKSKSEFYHVSIYDTVIVNVLHYIFMPFLTLIIA